MIYVSFIKLHLKSLIEYPKAFVTHTIAKLLGWGADFMMLFVMISQINELNGWGKYEMTLLFGVQLLCYSCAGFFFYQLKENLSLYIQRGELDQALTKPVNPLFYLVCKEFNTGYIANLLVAITAIGLSFTGLGISLDIKTMCIFIFSIAGGAMIYSAIMMIQVVIGFRTIRSNAVDTIDWVFQNISRYPLSIFHVVLKCLMTFVFPYAFINYFPVQIITGYEGFLGLPKWIMYLSFPIGLLFLFIMYRVWCFVLKKYSGSGS